jgi:hypothetical protein
MNVTEAKYLVTQVRIDSKYQDFEILVVKIQDNWFIRHINRKDTELW